MKLKASGDDLSSIWELITEARADAKIIKIEKELLTRVMLDHGELFNLHKHEVEK